MPNVQSRVFSASSTGPPQYSTEQIRARAVEHLGYQPCLWQIKVVEAILRRDGDVVCISATGSGKTLTFWLPLLFKADGIQLVISPLNILGDQNVVQLGEMGIKGISIPSETATYQNFQDIEDGKYRVIVTNVETLMQQDGGFDMLWKKPQFTSRLISIVWDEGHCVSKWAGFRPEYKEVGRLRFLIPRSIPFVILSATLPPAVLSDVMRTLQVLPDKVTIIRRSNDRPNIHLAVREMKYPMNSFKDLAFLIPENWKPGDPLPPKFLIFFDSIADSIEAAKFLRGRLPFEYRHKIKWFNSEMSTEFKETESDALKTGKIWGLSCTDSFGMGLDLPDILLVIQWRSTCDMCTLWQRLGRAARALHLTAMGLFLVEPKRFDSNIEKAEARAAKRAETSKKRKQLSDAAEQPAAKRAALAPPEAPIIPIPVPVLIPSPAEPVISDETTDPNDVADDDVDLEAPPPPSTMTLDEYRADRRAVYDAIVAQEPVLKKPALDDFINAAGRQPGDGCYREPAMIFFGNDKTVSTHIECRPDVPGGCTRCKISESKVCCELFSPADFADFAGVDIAKAKQQPSRSRIKPYKAESSDMALRDALHQFRKERTKEVLGPFSFRKHGAGAMMSDEVLDRIGDCAHYHTIKTTADLAKETNWHQVTEDGAKVLGLISQHRPIPLAPPPSIPTTTPLRTTTTSNNPSPAGPSTPKNRKCRKCGLFGHICLFSLFFLCPECALMSRHVLSLQSKMRYVYSSRTSEPWEQHRKLTPYSSNTSCGSVNLAGNRNSSIYSFCCGSHSSPGCPPTLLFPCPKLFSHSYHTVQILCPR
ncbi:P-loop containing nucleoside triphosphate hydrolase protein [Mycena leptocephala]|nr:P-loop containing nucleoside triphosphate hydrolase protein [Mycena leptocephala]